MENQEKENTKIQELFSGIHTQEPMLPCEFCSELIRFAALENHQLECGALRGAINRTQALRGWTTTTTSPRRIQLQIREDDINDDDDTEGMFKYFILS